MASFTSALCICLLVGCSYVLAEVEDLQPLVKSTEDTVQGAKTHVSHMLNLSPLPNEDKIPTVVKNESAHLSYEIKKLATSLHEKISVGEHKPEAKEAVTAAVTHLNEAAAGLEHVGSDLKQDNDKYYEAADKVLQETKNILAAGPCPEITPIIKGALNELTHDVNNYQYGIHNVIGPHEGGQGGAGHHEHKESDGHQHHHHHHVHKHHGASSEESSEESSSHHHHH